MPSEITETDIAVYADDLYVWHGLGDRVPQEMLTHFPEMYIHWPEVEMRGVYVPTADGFNEVPDQRFIVRKDNDHVVSYRTCGNGRGITQFSKITEAYEAIKETGVPVELRSAGTLNGGARAYLTIEVGKPIDVAGYSEIQKYFTIADSHDGTSSAKGVSTAGVVVCNNTFQAYVIGAPKAWSINHTRNAEQYLDDAVRGYTEALEQQHLIDDAVERLINEAYTQGDFMTELLPTLIGQRPTEEGRSRTMHDNKRTALVTRYWGEDLDRGIRETKWGALMAVQGYEQHERPVRGGTRQAKHMESLYFGTQNLTAKAAQILIDA